MHFVMLIKRIKQYKCKKGTQNTRENEPSSYK